MILVSKVQALKTAMESGVTGFFYTGPTKKTTRPTKKTTCPSAIKRPRTVLSDDSDFEEAKKENRTQEIERCVPIQAQSWLYT